MLRFVGVALEAFESCLESLSSIVTGLEVRVWNLFLTRWEEILPFLSRHAVPYRYSIYVGDFP